MSRPRFLALILGLITFAAYLPATRFAFINYDDNDYVTDNITVQKGITWAGVKWAFTTWHAYNWHPITWISHMADCTLFGLNPGAHHLVNVLFHSANAVLLFVLLWRLTRSIWPSAFVAALFAWHPLHVESVAWIAERKDVLSTFFALLALLNYETFVREKSRRSFWLAVLWFALGLMAKPMLVTLPFVLLLLDFWPLNRIANCLWKVENAPPPVSLPSPLIRLVLEKWPFFVLTIISCVITFLAQSNDPTDPAVIPLESLPLHYRVGNIPLAYAGYVQHLFWPARLAVFYPLAGRIYGPGVIAAVAALLLISVIAWRCRKTRPYFLIGWLFFLGTLVPVIGLVQVGGAALADRYSYLPSVGIFLIVAFAARDFLARFPAGEKPFAAAAVVILAACLCVTEAQLQFWRNTEILFRHALAVTEDNNIARNVLGYTLEGQGRLPEALAEYRIAEQLDPARTATHNNLGNLLDKLGRPAESLVEYGQAIRLRPKDPFYHTAAAYELTLLGRYDEALSELAIAENLNPKYPWTHVERARVYFKQGRDPEAVAELRTATHIAPEDYQVLVFTAHYLAANQNAAARNGPVALGLAIKANELSGGNQPLVFDVMGMAFAETGDFTNAQAAAQTALDLITPTPMDANDPIRQRLELYKKNQPWRESFRMTQAPVKN